MTETEETTTEETFAEETEENQGKETNLDNLTAENFIMSNEEETQEDIDKSTTDEEDSQESEAQSEETEETTEDGETEIKTEDGGTSEESSEITTEGESLDENSYNEIEEDEEVFAELTEETGVSISSYDDLEDSLKELKSLRDNGSPSTLSAALEAARKVEASGGNLAEHFARVGMDFEKMDSREVLRQKFFKDEAKLHSDNPKLAQMKFDKAFNEKYGYWSKFQKLTTQEDKDDFAEEHGQENIEYDKMMFENDVSNAKTELEKWKEEVKPIEVEKQIGVLTESEAKELADNYIESSKTAMEEFEATGIPMGEGIDDFALGLNDKTAPIVKQWIDDPAIFLQDLGFDGKEIDVNRMIPIMTLIAEASVGNLGGLIVKHATDSLDVETLERKINKPTSKTSPSIPQQRDTGGDVWEQLGNAAAGARDKAEA